MKDSDKGLELERWFMQKLRLHKQGRVPPFKEGEIWWCGIGENVGIEINGKSDLASRPVLVFKKFGKYGFLESPYRRSCMKAHGMPHSVSRAKTR